MSAAGHSGTTVSKVDANGRLTSFSFCSIFIDHQSLEFFVATIDHPPFSLEAL
jgi:hypothetical protein